MREDLCHAIRERRVVRFTYNGTERVVEPHILGVAANNRDVLFGWCREPNEPGRRDGWRTYALAAVSDVELLAESFAGPRPHYNPASDDRIPNIICALPAIREER